ncbi:MAG TPA: PAS domain S-box protein [Abditibacteriaceae bacterium]|jgi:PAS domain S-box-containing protein
MSNPFSKPGSESAEATEVPSQTTPSLALTEAHFRAMAQSSPDAIVLLSADGTILSANAAVVSILGVQPHELVGTNCFDAVHPDDIAKVQQGFAATLQKGKGRVASYRFRDSNAGWRWLESDAVNFLDDADVRAILVHSRDVTLQVEKELALKNAHTELHTVLDSVTDGFLILDPQWRVLLMNGRAESITGKTREEVLGRVLWDVFPDVVGTPFHRAHLRAFEEQVAVEVVDFYEPLQRWLEVTIYPSEHGVTAYTRDITDRKTVEIERAALITQIEAERTRLSTVLQHLPVAVVLAEAPGGKILMGNEQVAQVMRHPLLPSTNIADYSDWKGFHPDGRSYEPNEWPLARAVLTGEVVVNEEIEILRGDGTRGFISCSATPIFDDDKNIVAGLVTFHDISDRKETEQRLQEETESLETINQLGRMVSAELDVQTLVQAVTDAATELSGAQFGSFFYNVIDSKGEHYTLYTISGVPREAFSHFPMPRNTDVFAHTFNGTGILRSDDITQDTRYGKMGPHFGMPEGHLPVRSYLAAPVISRSGEVLGGLFFGHAKPGIFTERAERIVGGLAAQAAIAMDNARLFEAAGRERRAAEDALRVAEDASRTKDEFLAVVSHELRTPLNAILGWANLLNSGRLDEEGRVQALETIERNARSQAQLIEDLLDVSRIMTGNLRMELQPLAIVPIIEAAIDGVRPAAEAKQIRLRMLLDPWAGPVAGDATRLQQVVWNLLSNAVKFTPRGGSIDVSLERLDSHVQIEVTDSGEGIAPDFLPYIFDRFRQADSGTTRRHSGLGLGLSIVRQLVELHGGTVSVQSEGEGQGTTFSVQLPLPAIQVTPRAETTGAKESFAAPLDREDGAVAATDFSGVRILVVDDEPDSRAVLRAVLSTSKAQVRTASTAAHGLEILQDWCPQLLISDIGMPDEDGYSFIRKIRALESPCASVIAVALTAYARREDRTRALEAGFQYHLPKPVGPSELIDTITRALEKPGDAEKE